MTREMQTFGRQLSEMTDTRFSGRLFVVEGPDGSGRSTQVELLSKWLESNGFAVQRIGLRRSNLVSEELETAKEGNILTRTTLSLFYATDFFDQLINVIVPALRSGLIVLADRYIYTLMARDIVRGSDSVWVRNLYSPALVPDAVFYFTVGIRNLVDRNFQKNGTLDYWESGMDIGLSGDMYQSFCSYQRMLRSEFRKMQAEYGFESVDANRSVIRVQGDLRRKISTLLNL